MNDVEAARAEYDNPKGVMSPRPRASRLRANLGRPPWALNLIAARKRLGWSQKQIAEKLAASQTTVASWETGHNRPSIDTFRKLSGLLDVPIQELIGGASGRSTADGGDLPGDGASASRVPDADPTNTARILKLNKLVGIDKGYEVIVSFSRAVLKDSQARGILSVMALESGLKKYDYPKLEAYKSLINLLLDGYIYYMEGEMMTPEQAKDAAIASCLDLVKQLQPRLAVPA